MNFTHGFLPKVKELSQKENYFFCSLLSNVSFQSLWWALCTQAVMETHCMEALSGQHLPLGVQKDGIIYHRLYHGPWLYCTKWWSVASSGWRIEFLKCLCVAHCAGLWSSSCMQLDLLSCGLTARKTLKHWSWVEALELSWTAKRRCSCKCYKWPCLFYSCCQIVETGGNRNVSFDASCMPLQILNFSAAVTWRLVLKDEGNKITS